jgi:hypothetical protein
VCPICRSRRQTGSGGDFARLSLCIVDETLGYDSMSTGASGLLARSTEYKKQCAVCIMHAHWRTQQIPKGGQTSPPLPFFFFFPFLPLPLPLSYPLPMSLPFPSSPVLFPVPSLLTFPSLPLPSPLLENEGPGV